MYKFLALVALAFFLVFPATVLADKDTTPAPEKAIGIGNPLAPDFETPESQAKGGDVVGYFQGRLAGLLNVMFGALAVLSLIPVVFGGIQLITSQGSSEKVEKGKKSLFWGVAGLVLAFSAIVVFNFLLRVILPAQ